MSLRGHATTRNISEKRGQCGTQAARHPAPNRANCPMSTRHRDSPAGSGRGKHAGFQKTQSHRQVGRGWGQGAPGGGSGPAAQRHLPQRAWQKAAVHRKPVSKATPPPGLSPPDLCRGPVRTLKLNWSIMGYLDPSPGLPASLVQGGSTRKPVESVTSLQPGRHTRPALSSTGFIHGHCRIHTRLARAQLTLPLPPALRAGGSGLRAAAASAGTLHASTLGTTRETEAQLETTTAQMGPQRQREARARLWAPGKETTGSLCVPSPS